MSEARTGTALAASAASAASSRRKLLFASLYFSEGGPIGLIWWALPVWLRAGGMEPGDIARLIALVAWPWALKFVWAPWIDSLRGSRFGIRGAILSAQLFMALSLAPLLVIGFDAVDTWVIPLLLVHAIAASTQDAAIDTLAIHSIPSAERGAANGWMQVGMLSGRALFGGAAVLLAARFGERAVLSALLLSILLPAWILLRPTREPAAPAGPAKGALAVLREVARMFGRRTTWVGLLIASTVGASFESLASLAGPLLLDQGASSDLVGVFFLAPSVVCMGLGALLGGRLSDRFGRLRATVGFEALAAIGVAAVGASVLFFPGNPPLLVALLAAVYTAMGLATAALYAHLMDLTDPAIAATQFGVFMGGINLCYVWATTLVGTLIDLHGYGLALIAMAGCSLLALPLLRILPRPSAEAHEPVS